VRCTQSPPAQSMDDTSVRLSHELSEGEKEATGNRKAKVLECLKRLGITCDKAHMPNIAILGSGGGLRATIALMGTLVEMKKQGLLDAVMYLCGVSGSTWCMSTLYKEKDWSENVQDLEKRLCETLSSTSWDLQQALADVSRAAEDELFSLTDVWASFCVSKELEQHDQTKLSDHKDAATCGTNPYPIYAAVEENKLHNWKKEKEVETWFEFTPHESGFPGLGAFVSTKFLGSEFMDGHLKVERKTKDICYLQGLWGSIFGYMKENVKFLIGYFENQFETVRYFRIILSYNSAYSIKVSSLNVGLKKAFFRHCMDTTSPNKKCCEMSRMWGLKTVEERIADCAELLEAEFGEERFVSLAMQGFGRTKRNVIERRIHCWKVGEVISICTLIWKIWKCICHWTWGRTHNFLYNCDTIAQTSDLAKHKFLNLIDAGLAINSAYPLMLLPARRVTLILSFDFSSGDPFKTIRKTAKYCETNHIPFPKIDPEEIKDRDNPSDCYIFKGKDLPTVMHFPLFNKKNCPGEVEHFRKRFSTFTVSYTKGDVQELLKTAKMNVANNHERIVKEIQQL
uniref:PLA2c domain-containing protein n=1 Tax=Pelodiscus sinensis TaxID=13735 RepID=K7FJH5_PELSI